MWFISWCLWRLGGLSILALTALSAWTIAQAFSFHQRNLNVSAPDSEGLDDDPPSFLTSVLLTIFALYTLLNHVSILTLTVRATWSMWEIITLMVKEPEHMALHRSHGILSIASWVFSVFNSEPDDMELQPLFWGASETPPKTSIIHVIIIPNYSENIETLRETLDVLASHPQANICYDICLGMEARETNCKSKALTLTREFSSRFRSMGFTIHPADIPGEAAGKGSNVAWAACQLSDRYPKADRRNVIVTNIDADSHLPFQYFAHLTDLHFRYPQTAATSIYTAPIVFDRNAHQVSAVVRAADIFWCGAGISGFHKGSAIAPPTSVYSLPLVLVDLIGGWDCGVEAIGEDLHMFIKCFFALNGHLTCRVVPCPISQTNVSAGGIKGIRGVYLDIKARYRQSLRHMWGSLDTGYALRKAFEMWRNRGQTHRVIWPLHQGCPPSKYFHGDHEEEDGGRDTFDRAALEARGDSYADTSSVDIFDDFDRVELQRPRWVYVFYMAHRLFELHYLPVHLAILVIASSVYDAIMGSHDPHHLRWIFLACSFLRTVGLVAVLGFLFQYEIYHRISVKARRRYMTRAKIADGMGFSTRTWMTIIVDYLMTPLTAPLFSAIPLAHAELSHLWTLDIVYAVSKKSTRIREDVLFEGAILV